MTQRKIIEFLTILAKGCKEHRSYRALRDPQVECVTCKVMRITRKKLEDLSWPDKYERSIPAWMLRQAANKRKREIML